MSLPHELQQLVDMYASGKQGKRNWFTRRMKQRTTNEQDQVWKSLEAAGFPPPEANSSIPSKTSKTNRTMIIWTDDEWDQLAELVWRMRKNNPSDTLVSLAKRAMAQFPKKRQRNIRVNNELKPLAERLKEIDDKHLRLESELQSLRTHIQSIEEAPTRDQVIESLDDEEIFVHFSDRILNALTPNEVLSRYPKEMLLEAIELPDIAGALVSGLVESWSSSREESFKDVLRDLNALVVAGSKKPKIPTPQVSSTRLPKVTIIGMKSNQQQEVQRRLRGKANFNFVDKNRKADAIPSNQDVIVLWASFVTHSMQDQAKKAATGGTKLIIHHGGIEKMVHSIEEALCSDKICLTS